MDKKTALEAVEELLRSISVMNDDDCLLVFSLSMEESLKWNKFKGYTLHPILASLATVILPDKSVAESIKTKYPRRRIIDKVAYIQEILRDDIVSELANEYEES